MEKDNIAWCPKCGDALEVIQKALKKYENWTYYCFGCDCIFELKLIKKENGKKNI